MLLAAAGVLIAAERRRARVALRGAPFLGMALESVVYALCLGAVVGTATRWLLDGIPVRLAAGGGVAALSLPEGVVLSLGAGIYEELLFRVLLVGGLFGVFRASGLGRGKAGSFAALLAALLFSAFHYVGPYGDAWEIPSFLFRFLAGLAFSVLFLVRGFGIAAWTHALYDVFLLVARGPESVFPRGYRLLPRGLMESGTDLFAIDETKNVGDIVEVLRNGRVEILKDWVDRVRDNTAVQTGQTLSDPLLLDHMPQLFDAILDRLETNRSREDAEQFASVHGFTRRITGYDVIETVLELLVFRRAIWAYLTAVGASIEGAYAAMERIDGMVDRAVITSLQAFLDPSAGALKRPSRPPQTPDARE